MTNSGESSRAVTQTERELIVIAKSDVGLRAADGSVASATGADISEIANFLAAEGVSLTPLFGISEDRMQQRAAALETPTGVEVPDLSVFYRVEAADEQLDALAMRLASLDAVETAYVKPPAEPPTWLNDMQPQTGDTPPATPDFTAHQLYLEAAPGGIDARYAWTQAGGTGSNVRIIDIEGAWRFSHEDLTANQGGVVGGTQSTDIRWRNHGTAVVGEYGGDRNTIGITGICPDANASAISIFGGTGSANAIRQAADRLQPGDIILLELHRPGPQFNFAPRDDQRGYIAIEWWEDDFAAIRYATLQGVIVVEAAGNGAENLDDPIYSTRPAGFPNTWTNPFNRSNRDSGAIVVGAGAPPPGTHGRDHGPDRSRLGFSNYGALIDAQGWGREVTTAGYGDLQGGTNEDFWYTDTFSGTSSASPIVVGALGSLQGFLRAKGSTPLTPAQARQILRETGSAQQNAPDRPATQRIGNRPNLRQMIGRYSKSLIKDLKDGKAEIKEGKEIKLEKREIKELKVEKVEIKEGKNEIKERIKDFKEFNIEKGLVDIKVRESLFPGSTATGQTASGNPQLEDRLTALESQIAQLVHFISPELRPDLATGALASEPYSGDASNDPSVLSQQLQKQANEAKSLKDNKDSLREMW